MLRKQVKAMDPIILTAPQEVVKLVSASSTNLDHDKFVNMIKDNNYFAWQNLYGYNEPGRLLLKSGKHVTTTEYWNPAVMAFIHGHGAILDLITTKRENLDLSLLLKIYSPDGSDGLFKLLELMIEN